MVLRSHETVHNSGQDLPSAFTSGGPLSGNEWASEGLAKGEIKKGSAAGEIRKGNAVVPPTAKAHGGMQKSAHHYLEAHTGTNPEIAPKAGEGLQCQRCSGSLFMGWWPHGDTYLLPCKAQNSCQSWWMECERAKYLCLPGQCIQQTFAWRTALLSSAPCNFCYE